MSASPGLSLAPHPDIAQDALYDGSGLRRNLLTTVLFGYVRAEWALALGSAKIVNAAVVGTEPSAEFSRSCTMTQINVVWPVPGGANPGQFSVCDNQASQFPAGKVIQVAAVPGDTSVVQGESRAAAIFGAILESLACVFVLWILASGARQWLVLATARHRWGEAPWLAGEAMPGGEVPGRKAGQPVIFFLQEDSVPWQRPPAKIRGRTCLARSFPRGAAEQAERRGLDPDKAVGLLVQRRKDGALLESGDQVWVAPVGRTLIRHVRTAPYAVIRAADRRVFWAMGQRMPGRDW